MCPLCSQNAHDETVLVRCAQWETNSGHPPGGSPYILKSPPALSCAPGARALRRTSLDGRSRTNAGAYASNHSSLNRRLSPAAAHRVQELKSYSRG